MTTALHLGEGLCWVAFRVTHGAGVDRASAASGTVTEFPVPTANSPPSGIAAGPDGNMWFTEQVEKKIGRIQAIAAMSTTTLAAGPNPAVVGQPVTSTTHVACTAGTAPTGSVTFFEGATPIGTVPVNGTGVPA
jgi:streptogramin lyase